jgi:hypothetical protein
LSREAPRAINVSLGCIRPPLIVSGIIQIRSLIEAQLQQDRDP